MAYLYEYFGFSNMEWSVGQDFSKEAAELVGLDVPSDEEKFFANSIDEDQFMRILDGQEAVPDEWGDMDDSELFHLAFGDS